MVSTIEVSKNGMNISLKIDTECKMVKQLGEGLAEVSRREALKPQVESAVYQWSSKVRCHTACPLPTAILKAIEVEARLALPRPVSITFEPSD
jgi:hypothetical protein